MLMMVAFVRGLAQLTLMILLLGTCAMDGPADALDDRLCPGMAQLMLMMLALAGYCGDLRNGTAQLTPMMLAFVWGCHS